MKLTSYEKRNYVMEDEKDFIILSKIRKLERKKLGKSQKEMVRLIRSQLKKNWRLPLIKQWDKLINQNL